ncbi:MULTISPECIES: hypothetical protein [Nocardiaceae]|jgi:hypothetical protein|uniref:Uncharacterized protein n=1 Tax=Rhodococcoides kroppenstedtii TaxID=293050 RepID=A0A1I0TJ13_9NOCA|nr:MULTISPECIES: hypothetical protein [Rhodococcus]AMY17696.1 hypothetical protein A3Q40_00282 [Rhodococcus sp. PBTS 1]MBT1190997.1 hypothetical protein [Rhodococcus kroppenstedtii]MBY6314136.1 hypothetical protein [Rhodococcus kroppenstedtii]MBY6321909.1 hypothetical protein [Rhodococcus kroppenstedtii]MBY6400455.1 hypothetical protein [Rhodococcus kroppenstedtii]
MIYVVALIGLVVVAVLLWKSFGPETAAPRGRVTGPDDDPEFLWRMGRDAARERRRSIDRPEAGTDRPDTD